MRRGAGGWGQAGVQREAERPGPTERERYAGARAERGSCLGQSRERKERRVGPGEGEEGVGRGKGWAAGLSWVWVALGWFSSLGFWAGLQGFGLGSHV